MVATVYRYWSNKQEKWIGKNFLASVPRDDIGRRILPSIIFESYSHEMNPPYFAKYWYLGGLQHRGDGPAIERLFWSDSLEKQEWYLNGVKLSFDGWLSQMQFDEEWDTYYRLIYS